MGLVHVARGHMKNVALFSAFVFSAALVYILVIGFGPFQEAPLYEGKWDGSEMMDSGRVLDVPFVQGRPWYCSEASASMVLKYYGYEVSQEEIHDNGYESFEQMLPFLQLYVSCEYASLGSEKLKEKIDQGDPVMIRILVGRYRHTLVVVGYGEDFFCVHDPGYPNGEFLKANPEVLLEYWQQTGFLAIIFTVD